MTAQPMTPGTVQLVDYTATYADTELNPYTMDQCITLQAQAGPIPVVDKSPDPINTTSNQNVTWTIQTGNTAPVSAPDTTTLWNVTLTDVLPAGLTFVSSVPMPASITPMLDGTTVLTWNLANIPANTPLGGGPTVTLTVRTPSHTTAVFTNTVTLAGTDPGGTPGFDNCPNTAVATATFIVDNVPEHVTQVGLDGSIIIPPQKPPAETLLVPIVQVEVTNTSVIRTPVGTKVVAGGFVHLLIPYVADEAVQGVHAVGADLPWQTFILWPELPPDAQVKVTVRLESADVKLIDPRTIGKYIVFQVGVERA